MDKIWIKIRNIYNILCVCENVSTLLKSRNLRKKTPDEEHG